ncbi:MAG: MinD/ParA family protein [Microbacteriaceae bacterium]|nr:MinD/ParA family protein [Microbacteriaceae bacterium]
MTIIKKKPADDAQPAGPTRRKVATSTSTPAVAPSRRRRSTPVAPESTADVPVTVSVSTTEIVIPVTTGEIPIQLSVDTQALPTRRERKLGESVAHPEPVALLTPDRVLDLEVRKDAPSEGLNRILYNATLGLVNRGDSPAVRHRKAIDMSIGRRVGGSPRFVAILTRKGGVGKTTVTTLLGMALARVRDDRVIAIDANPDRGTLAERFVRGSQYTVRDVVNKAATIGTVTDFSNFVSRDKSRLDVLASDTDPLLSEAFDENDFNVVADIVSRYYSIALVDCGTGIVHSVMRATLQRADAVVVVSGGSFDEARLAAETLTWLDANGYGELVRNAVVTINTATMGTNMVKLDEIESHFKSRVRDVVRIPYDPLLAAGSVVDFDRLKPVTREAARILAALVVDGLRDN